MTPSKHENLVTVFETADVNLLSVVKSVLQGAEIPFLVQGEEALNMLPLGQMGGPFMKRGLGVAIRVRPEDAEVVEGLLASVGTDGRVDSDRAGG